MADSEPAQQSSPRSQEAEPATAVEPTALPAESLVAAGVHDDDADSALGESLDSLALYSCSTILALIQALAADPKVYVSTL